MRNIMKRLLGLALLALPLCVSMAQANNQICISLPGTPLRADFGFNFHLNVVPLAPNASQLGPWYLYWPQEAYFVVPAPTGYPYWPSPMVLPNMALGGPQGVPPPPPGAVPAPPAVVPAVPQLPAPAVKPVSYPAPAYWYDR
jgi:hypothetical protein